MNTFGLELSEYVGQTKIDVYELHKDGVSLFSEFWHEVAKDVNYQRVLVKALVNIEHSANGISLPGEKWKKIGVVRSYTIFEAKGRNKMAAVRIYVMHENKVGRIIIIAGKKSTQENDIRRVEGIIKDYHDETKENK